MENIIFKHGLNEHQAARFEEHENQAEYDISDDLSYTEFLSIAKGLELISEFYDVPAACSIKGANICAAALGQGTADAVQKILDSDPIDFMNSTIVMSAKADSETAKFFKSSNIIAAPEYTANSEALLKTGGVKHLTLKTPLKDYKNYLRETTVSTPLGNLIQAPNFSELNKETFKVVTKQKPTVEQIEDAVFAWKVTKYIPSQAVVIAKDLKTSAISQGLKSASVEASLDYSCDMSKEAILASDLPLSIHDIDSASQGRIALVIVPFADKDVILRADKYGMSLITTGISNILY